MISPIRELVICTNGDPHSRHALTLGGWLALRLGTHVTLLGIVESARSRRSVQRALDEAEAQIRGAGVEVERQMREARAEEVIAGWRGPAGSLLTVGPFGRPLLLRWLRGRSLRRLMVATAHPILYVPKSRTSVDRMLLCLGGLSIGLPAEALALDLARGLSAHLTLFHVMEPIGYDYPISREMQLHANSLLESDTPQARMLGEALAAAREIDPSAELVVGHGSTVNQILEEIRRKDYDLVCLGSPGNARSLRRLYTPNVTAEIAELGGLPVLIGGDAIPSKSPSGPSGPAQPEG